MFYRCIKPEWAVRTLLKNEEYIPNPKFIKEIPGKDKTIEGCFTPEQVFEFNQMGYNAYFFPNHPSTNVYEAGTRHLSGKMIDTFNYVFVDMDSKDGVYTVDEFLDTLREFPIKPSLTLKSGHGVHAYWKMANLTREEYIFTQFALLRHFKTDESVWTVLQLMRVPGSQNTKEVDNFRQTEIVEDLSPGNPHNNVSCFPPEILKLSKEDITKAQNHLNKLDGIADVGLEHSVDLDTLPDSFINLMATNDTVRQLFENPIEFYGDRSGADMKLTNILFHKKIPKKEAYIVISNTQKALSKGAYRVEYTQATIDKAYIDRTPNKFKTVGQQLKMGALEKSLDYISGPIFFDCQVNRWAKKQVLGLVAGAGVGKTTVTFKIIKAMIENNFNKNDDVYVFFSLEMTEGEIMKRWVDLVGVESPLADRLYVIGNEDENGDPRNIGLQEIQEYCTDIKTQTGRNIGSIAIDHIGIMSLHIDIKKKYTFGIESEQKSGHGDMRTMSINHACTQMKSLSKMLDTFVILLTQTTKEKGKGHTPLGKDAAYGISQYEWIVDYMITLWQPLMLIQDSIEHRFLAWQYAKNRHQHGDDPIKVNSYQLLSYEMSSGDLRAPTEDEYRNFTNLLPMAQEQAKLRESKTETNYVRSVSQEAINDLQARLSEIK